MEFNLLSFDSMLSGLLTKQELEEHLSHVIRNIETEFDFQSIGVYLKVPNSEIFRMKISRNISHTFAKNSIFTKDDQLIEDLKLLKLLDIRKSGRYKFEKEYSHLLVLPLYFCDELLGFVFIDKCNEIFDSEEITKIKLFASIISITVQLNLQHAKIEQHSEIYESARVYLLKAFIEKSEVLLSLMKRYNLEFTIAVIRIENFENLVRTIGGDEVEEILKQISEIIKDTLRETDIIGRIRKDAFAISMPETSTNNCVLTISRMNNKILELPMKKTCKISWGIATKDDKIKSADNLLKFAEHAANDSNKNEKGNITIYK